MVAISLVEKLFEKTTTPKRTGIQQYSLATVDKQDRLEAFFELCGARLHDSVVPKHVFLNHLFQIPNVSFCLDLLPGLSLHPLLC